MDISQEITLIVIRSVIILLAAIGICVLILDYKKKKLRFILEKMGSSGTGFTNYSTAS